jgi:hypothetical protein
LLLALQQEALQYNKGDQTYNQFLAL